MPRTDRIPFSLDADIDMFLPETEKAFIDRGMKDTIRVTDYAALLLKGNSRNFKEGKNRKPFNHID